MAMTMLQLLMSVRDVLYERTEQHYPILDAVTLFEGMDAVEYEYTDDNKLVVTLTLNLPVTTGIDYNNARG